MHFRISLLEFPKDSLIVLPLLVMYRLILVTFRFMDFMWPKKDDLLVFSGQGGQKLSGNSKHLFQKFIEHYRNEFQIVWITRDRSLVESLHSERTENGRACISVFIRWNPNTTSCKGSILCDGRSRYTLCKLFRKKPLLFSCGMGYR